MYIPHSYKLFCSPRIPGTPVASFDLEIEFRKKRKLKHRKRFSVVRPGHTAGLGCRLQSARRFKRLHIQRLVSSQLCFPKSCLRVSHRPCKNAKTVPDEKLLQDAAVHNRFEAERPGCSTGAVAQRETNGSARLLGWPASRRIPAMGPVELRVLPAGE